MEPGAAASPSLSDLCVSRSDAALATDLYELTMAAAYFRSGQSTTTTATAGGERDGGRAVFEGFVRKLPRNRSYMVAAGLEQVLDYICNLEFTDNQIAYLRSLKAFERAGDDFFDYLKRFRFTGDVWVADEGTVLFQTSLSSGSRLR